MNPTPSHTLLLAGGAFVLTAALIWIMLRVPRSSLPLDAPNERSLHTTPVPRTGGLAIMIAVTLIVACAGWQPLLVGCAVALAAISFLDDRSGLPTLLRFGVHLLVAIAFVVWQGFGVAAWLLAVFALAIVWMTNLFNFMDGSDGLAGGMALFGFGAYAIAAWLQGEATLAAIALIIVAAVAAFLLFNFHPAQVFMGDAGSIPLGFLAAAIGLIGWQSTCWPPWFPIVVFAPFIADATITLVRRALRGERVWQAHKSHYYQRLVQLGWGHARTAYAEYALMAALAAIALVSFRSSLAMQVLALAIAALIVAISAVLTDRAWQRRQPIERRNHPRT